MKRTWTLFGVVAVTGAALTIAVLSRPGAAAPEATTSSSTSPSSSPSTTPPTTAPPIVVQSQVLSMAAAQQLANVAQQDCATRGFAVTVAVVDRDGVDIVVQRADGATGATVDVARGKAHAAAGFQSPTAALQDAAKTNPGLISLPNFVGVATGALERSGMSPNGDLYLCGIHMKRSMHEAVCAELGVALERASYLDDTGHMSGADPLVGLDRASRAGLLSDGDAVLLLAAGTGYTWAASVVRWGIGA